jgi:DNA repair ATPase RecN
VEELSRMLGGIEITERTRAHAAEMIERAAR